MKKDDVKRQYQRGEEAADSLLDRLIASPWTLAALVGSHAVAFALGAWLF